MNLVLGTLLDVEVERRSSRQYVSIWLDSMAREARSAFAKAGDSCSFWGHKAVNWRVRRAQSALVEKAMSFVFMNFLASFLQFSYNCLIFNYFLASFPHSLFACICFQKHTGFVRIIFTCFEFPLPPSAGTVPLSLAPRRVSALVCNNMSIT